MRIRTRFFLSLFPWVGLTILLSALFLLFLDHRELEKGISIKLETAALAASSLFTPETDLVRLAADLQIAKLEVNPTATPSDFLIAYAPIQAGKIGAFLPKTEVEALFAPHLVLILLGATGLLILSATSLFFLADKLTDPIEELNKQALAIAAGQYGETINIRGPREIKELEGTLNTMSECLLENINRLEANSYKRAQKISEAECAHMLQTLAIEKSIDSCRSDALSVRSLSIPSENPRGLLLDFPPGENPSILLAEAKADGLEGLYELLLLYKSAPEGISPLRLTLDRDLGQIHLQEGGDLPKPLLFSLKEKQFKSSLLGAEAGDFLLLFNQGLLSFYKTEAHLADWTGKVLKFFGAEGLDTVTALLEKELLFATHRKKLENDLHLLVVQILSLA